MMDFRKVFDTIDHKISCSCLGFVVVNVFGCLITSLTSPSLFSWEVFCPVLIKLFLEFRNWTRYYFHCMSLTYRTVCNLLMC